MLNESVLEKELSNLHAHITKLNAQIKEKQSILRSLADEIETAKANNAKVIQDAEAAMHERLTLIEEKVGPLEAEIARLEQQRQTMTSDNQSKEEEYRLTFQSIKAEKRAELAKLDKEYADKMNVLVGLQQAISDCKQRVAAL